jgi:hypothetical protein
VYEHNNLQRPTALVGHSGSSFANQETIEITRVAPHGLLLVTLCGCTGQHFRLICNGWQCWQAQYHAGLRRPPRDLETVLIEADRYVRVGRFERNGRRQVYRELGTNRLFYVDNKHHGLGAHLEVFDAQENHLGTADLHGNVDATRAVNGRTISW